MTGPDVPKNISVSGKPAGASAIAFTEYFAGKPGYELTMTLGKDGKTLTATSGPLGKKNETDVEVFEKQ